LGLSRYPVFQPQNTPNTRKRILSPIMPCFRGFGVFRGSLIFGDKSQYMVAAPSSRVGRGESEGKSRVRLIVFSPDVVNCRQTVDALLAPLPPLGSGWLRFGSRRFAIPGRSHLSPDGGGPYSPRFHRLAADGYDSTADDSTSPDVATCRQTVEALLAPHHRLAADDYDSTADDSPSPDVATCRQTVEALLATHHRLAADGYDSKADDSRSPAVATCRQTVDKHPVSRDSGSNLDVCVPAMNSTTIRTQRVRILHLRYKTTCSPLKNEGSRTTLATHWTTH
jgi:hypothetical protein